MPHPHNPIKLSENFFSWGYRTKFFRRFIALAVTGTGAYVLFPLWQEKSQVWYLVPACLCLVLAFIFGFLVLGNLIECVAARLGRWKLSAVFAAASVYAIWHTASPIRLSDPFLWTSLVCAGMTLLVAIDIIVFPENKFGFKTFEPSSHT